MQNVEGQVLLAIGTRGLRACVKADKVRLDSAVLRDGRPQVAVSMSFEEADAFADEIKALVARRRPKSA